MLILLVYYLLMLIMSEDYKTNNNIECDCPCDYETALYFAQCATRPDQDPNHPGNKLKFREGSISTSPEPEGLTESNSMISNALNNAKGAVINESKNVADALKLAAAMYLQQTATYVVKQTGRKIIDVITPTKDRGGNGNNGGGKSSDDPRSSNYRGGGFGLTYDAKPIELRLNTGIKPKTYTSIYEDAVDLFSSPLHMTLVRFAIPSNPMDQTIDIYFNKVISFIFTNALQQASPFSVDTTNVFTVAKLRVALNSIIDALCTYFFFNSVVTYTQNSQNRNEGMLGMRESLTATDLNNMLNLKRILMGCPIPPNFISFFFYLNQTFQLRDVPGSPLHKICPVLWKDDVNTPDPTQLVVVADNLQSADNKAIFSQLSRIVPNWLGQKIPDIAWAPIYDPNFNTIWANLPGYYYNGTTYYRTPDTSSTSPNFKYVSFTNDLDGAAYCLTSSYNTTNTKWEPTFCTVHTKLYNTNNKTNRVYWSYGGTWSDACTSLVHTLQRSETYQINTNFVGTKVSVHLPGSQICQQVNYNTISETTLRLLDYLMSMETIGRTVDNREYIGKAYYELKPAPKKGKPKK